MTKIKQIQIGENTFDLGVNAENIDGYITEIPIASAGTLGGIKVGDNLEITEDGVLSATGGGSNEIAGTHNKVLNRNNSYVKIHNYSLIVDSSMDDIEDKYIYILKYVIQDVSNYTDTDIDNMLTIYFRPFRGEDGFGLFSIEDMYGIVNKETRTTGLYCSYYSSNKCVNIAFDMTVNWNETGNITSIRLRNRVETPMMLPINNEIVYEPSSNYHPATKKYVDDAIASAITATLEGEY